MDIIFLCERFCEYSLTVRGYSKETIRRYKCVVKSFSRCMGITEIEQVSEEILRNLFYYGRTKRNWSVTTYITYHKTLLVFFRWCVKQGYLSKNPAEGIEIPKKEKTLPKAITKQQALRLLETIYNYPYQHKYLRYRNHAIFSTFIFAGLRKQELLNLKYSEVDIENLTLFVRRGKGNKDRIIPISSTLAESLKKFLIERNRMGKTCPEFFCSLTYNRGLSENGLKNMIVLLKRASGIKFTAHALRHTFATLMLEGGCDIYNLSHMMGHSNILTTTIYLSTTVEFLRGQMVKHPLNDLIVN